MELNINSAIWYGSIDTHQADICGKYGIHHKSYYVIKWPFRSFLAILWHMAFDIFAPNIGFMGIKEMSWIAELIFDAHKKILLKIYVNCKILIFHFFLCILKTIPL